MERLKKDQENKRKKNEKAGKQEKKMRMNGENTIHFC